MNKTKRLTPKQKNTIKSETYPNIYSILGFIGSCCLLVTTNLINNMAIVYIVAAVLFLVIAILGHVFTKYVWIRLENGDKVTNLRKKINRCANLTGYLSYPLFALSALDILSK